MIKHDSEKDLYESFDIDTAQRTLDRTIGFINSCDTKASIMLAVLGVILTIIFTSSILDNIVNMADTISKSLSLCNWIFIVSSALSAFLFIFGVVKLTMVLYAMVSVSGEDSKIYFLDISKNENYTSYKNKLQRIKSNDLLDDIANQIYINAVICSKKYERYNKGLKFSLIGLAMLLILYIIGILIY